MNQKLLNDKIKEYGKKVLEIEKKINTINDNYEKINNNIDGIYDSIHEKEIEKTMREIIGWATYRSQNGEKVSIIGRAINEYPLLNGKK